MKDKNPTIASILEHLAQTKTSPKQIDIWPAVQASLAAGKHATHKEFKMNKRTMFTALTAAFALIIVTVLMARNVTPVSAQAVLDKAYAAQTSVTSPAQGIEHIRNRIYTNIQALSEDQGIDTTIESYRDLQTGNIRTVTINNKTDEVLDVFAYDGTYTYSTEGSKLAPQNAGKSGPLTVYRSPQERDKLVDLKPLSGEAQRQDNSREVFEQMRQDPNVQLVGQETWEDGRAVYALRSHQLIKVLVEDKLDRPTGDVTVYFDAQTYKMLGNRVTMQKNGKELLISSQKILADETLPAGTPVAWDLSDLQGITFVDDFDRQKGDLLPELITREELLAKTKNAYLLGTIPAGYILEIVAPPKQPANEPFIYIASYRTADNDYFVIQAGGEQPSKAYEGEVDTYTTAAGLRLHFLKEFEDPASGKQYTSAFVEAPGGVVFMLSSTLPRETVKTWAEGLVLVK